MDQAWWASYQPGVPREIDMTEFAAIPAVLARSVERFGDRPAFLNMGKSITYTELDQQSSAFAAYLQHDLKLPRGARVAVMLPNLLQYPIAIFGILRAGMVVVNVNPLYTPRELQHQLKDSGAAAIVILANFAHTLEEILGSTDVKHVLLTEIGDRLSLPKRLLVNAVVKHIKKMVPAFNLPGHTRFNDAISAGGKKKAQPVELDHSDIAFLQYTGGTTGVAKGAILTHGNIVANMQQAHAWIAPLVDEGTEMIVTALPLYHIFSLTANCMVFSKIGATNLLITNPRDIPGFVKEIGKYPVTCMTGVNTLFNALLNHADFAKLDFSKWKLALGGGMAVQHAVADRWVKTTGVRLIEAYGLTETSPAAMMNPMNLPEFNGMIGLPIPSTIGEVRNEEGKVLPPGEAGELFIHGPQVMAGYWQRPDETAKVLGKDGFVSTGDVAIMSSTGFFRLVDRKKDMILVSGFNVYPNEIEDVVASHPGVLEVACIGVDDERSGEAVKIFVVKKDPNLSKDDIIAHCRKNLTNYKIPRQVEFRDSLPKSNVGKILRRELRPT
ncbi:AMP-binding protein [Iodobacter fluviatilis]|uniref:Long-chain-fatty-acid--CoA ligase n=1 Tax=Iodobacter fluviatilis TaxID=537 RepID=A0A377Q7W4_9NEIS|nr:AMP-binding protein [Iodobacter fluviatilis]TCU89438.1 long-chain acyl-CoA synthetase [Iodobacter fluviatilis]STQ90808.1 Long-chain-fatty-acid--CoA ligase [Iodobacter fluviatilis]